MAIERIAESPAALPRPSRGRCHPRRGDACDRIAIAPVATRPNLDAPTPEIALLGDCASHPGRDDGWRCLSPTEAEINTRLGRRHRADDHADEVRRGCPGPAQGELFEARLESPQRDGNFVLNRSIQDGSLVQVLLQKRVILSA